MEQDLIMREQKNTLLELKELFWFEYQSPLLCKLGSDGVGHDLIHPADKLQGACRNAWTMYQAVCGYQDEIDLKKLEFKRHIVNLEKTKDPLDEEEIGIRIRQCTRNIERLKLEMHERLKAFEAFYAHIEELRPLVESQYKSIEEAYPEIFMARVAYNAQLENHPLGKHLKTTILTEPQKDELLRLMDFPTHMNGHELPMPNADAVLAGLEASKRKKELSHG